MPRHGGNLQWAAAIARCRPEELLDFSASISPLGPSAAVQQAMEQGLASIAAYPNPDYGELRQRLARHHEIGPDWVLPGNGAAELLTWAGRDLAGCDRNFLITPAFGDYSRALAAFGGSAEALPLTLENFPVGLSVTFPALSPKDGIVINNPHNPTGYLWSASQLRPLVESGALVVVDEAFMDFLPPGDQQSLIPWVQQFPNLVVVRSLTKFHSLAGLRLGYALLHPERAARWQRWRDPWPVNSLAVLAAGAALADTVFQAQTWAWLPAARQRLLGGLRSLTGLEVYPGAANFLLIRSEVSCTALQMDLLRKHRILVRDCMSFETLGDRFFRVAVRTDDDNRRLIMALASVLPGLVSPSNVSLPHLMPEEFA